MYYIKQGDLRHFLPRELEFTDLVRRPSCSASPRKQHECLLSPLPQLLWFWKTYRWSWIFLLSLFFGCQCFDDLCYRYQSSWLLSLTALFQSSCRSGSWLILTLMMWESVIQLVFLVDFWWYECCPEVLLILFLNVSIKQCHTRCLGA